MRITGVTKEDCIILDKLWSLDTVEELDRYLKNLNEEELKKTLTLIELCQLAEIDASVEQMVSCTEAEQMLRAIKK